jgi:hypothetical protein
VLFADDRFDLMYLENEAVANTMLPLKREHGVVCLSVHDSIIVPIRRGPRGECAAADQPVDVGCFFFASRALAALR